MVEIELRNLTKLFGDVVAADHINLTIKDGEFFTLLGPSGCGKTTTMRLIAGLEFPTEGKVFFDGRDVTGLPSFERNTGMVFQNYALWPHMTVWENVVTACGPCNRRKGNRTPEEAGMPLLQRPSQPRYLAITLLAGANTPQAWGKYMYT